MPICQVLLLKKLDIRLTPAGEHFRERKLRPAIIEKDYFVTEALRIIAHFAGDEMI